MQLTGPHTSCDRVTGNLLKKNRVASSLPRASCDNNTKRIFFCWHQDVLMTPYTFNGHLIKPLHDEPRGQWNPSILTSRAVAPFHTETCLWICNRLGKFYVKTCIVLQKSNHHRHNNWFCSRQINCITLLIRLKSTNDIYNKPFETTKEMRNIWSKCNILRPKKSNSFGDIC